jgi:tetratricopeptide (TPR) repeat protein
MRFFLSVFRSYKIAGHFQNGRRSFLAERFQEALAHFEKAARCDADYVFESGLFRQGIWTYIGRSQYNLRRLADARTSLERALNSCKDDPLARLYLGLTLARRGDEANGGRAIEAGMKGLHEWLEYVNVNRPFEAFWDPQREIRSAIENSLAMISSNKIDRQELISRGESVGQRMENEIDYVRREASRPND